MLVMLVGVRKPPVFNLKWQIFPCAGFLPINRFRSFIVVWIFLVLFQFSINPRIQRYGLLITCLITRAVHVKLTYSLSADSFINSFRQFVSRRGCPRSIKSDRATNFVGANKSLNEAIKVLNPILPIFLQSRKFIGNSIPPQHRILAVFGSA